MWHRSHIGHRSEYSVERLLAFRDYYKRTSFTRAVAVCMLTPIPAITVALLIDCTPLRPPSEGWQANYGFWIRWFLALVAVSVGVTLQVREVILPGAISNAGAVVISLGTAVTDVAVAFAVAVTWRFPIPFGYVLMVGPYLLIVLSLTLLVIGRRLLAESSVLRQQIKSQATIIFAQGAVAMAYPFFTAVFYQLSGPGQTVFVLVIPLFKHVTKHIIANAAQGLHEYIGPIVVFSVDVFNVFYVAICMQISKTMVTTLLIIASDSFHVIVALRDIFHHAKVVTPSRDEEPSSSMNYLEDLPNVIRDLFEDADILSRGCRIRVAAPFPLPLSDESSALLNSISRDSRTTRTFSSSSRVNALGPAVLAAQQVTKPQSLDAPKQHQALTASSAPTLDPEEKLQRKGSSPTRLPTLIHPGTATSANRLHSALPRTAAEEAVRDALQTLFHSEYLLMAEYTECTLPMLYAVYLPTLYHLPAAPYYPQTASSTPEKLTQDVINILIFGAVEFAGFVVLLFLLKRKFGISPLYQLAFVLETQMRTVQGHLFVWTVFILHMPLKHYGKFFLCLVLAPSCRL
ncbi:hypothetical protein PHYPSEUDO_003602 [Phytophthora pseudosyringae]|uniref:Transmembrane protein n=1 Tax=Phytophthora pseudosyringae TaxID=221518 RepID=A0A8T1VTX7_9STRA|nr:hypothetical protein PHYPSEUDO_003602 [Phytophthora pseudosyringae]